MKSKSKIEQLREMVAKLPTSKWSNTWGKGVKILYSLGKKEYQAFTDGQIKPFYTGSFEELKEAISRERKG